MKVFISYSHKDDGHRNALENHLSSLKRSGLITTWSDRKLQAGDDWANSIDSNLEEANIILFLVSSDFIASDYCIDIEFKRAIEKHRLGEATLIPIIVRDCDWKDSELGKIQALPRDANPVDNWDKKDAAWAHVVQEIRNCINQLAIRNKSKTNPHRPNYLADNFKDWLDESEIELSHRRKDVVKLTDIFVYQDLRRLDDNTAEAISHINSSHPSIITGWNLIYGEEQSGKTSLAKNLFINALNHNKLPIFINGDDIATTDIEKLIKRALENQYLELNTDHYYATSGKIIIIDDYSNTSLNRKHQIIFIEKLKENFDSIIIIAKESFQYVAPDISSLDRFSHFELMRFTNTKRYELIKKWVELGVKQTINEDQLYRDIDSLKHHIDTLVKNNTVPSKPIYLLTILQIFESYSPLGLELTSYGHCYQYLIYKALAKSNIRQLEVESYINYLTELAGHMFTNKLSHMSRSNMDQFFNIYSKKYISPNRDRMSEKLLQSGILVSPQDDLSFKYRYIYYFYAAKYLSEHLTENDKNRAEINRLILNLHNEDCANIIIFITHHTKDSWIIDEIELSMMELFQDNAEATLVSDDLDFMHDFLEEIPRLILEQREIEKEREKDNAIKDITEELDFERSKRTSDREPTDLLAKIDRAFKGIEIIGQILRNRHGSLDKNALKSLMEQAYSVGLRFLQYFLMLSKSAETEIVDAIKYMLTENPGIKDNHLEKEARNLFSLLTYGVIYGVLQKISFSLGAPELDELYSEIAHSMDTPAVKLINQSIELQSMKRLHLEKIGQLSRELDGNPACSRVLRQIVIQYIYTHPVEFRDKQRICDLMGIPIRQQLLLGQR